ncbi:hypothetical protein P7C71_g3559, partial [Lecanoromycetidae sp. Uapishka_2]
MPVYVLHGFRWPRVPVRQFIIVQDVNEAASDYIMHTATPDALHAAMSKLWPDIMARLPNLQFIEQHDPENPATQPFAFVADVVVKSSTHLDIDKTREQGPKPAAWEAFMDLKEELQNYAKQFNPNIAEFPVGWYAVYNGDPDRYQDRVESSGNSGEDGPATEAGDTASQQSGDKGSKKSNILKKIFR